MTVGPIRPTLLSQSCSWRRNSIPGAAHFWPDADPAARTSIQSGRFTLRRRACRPEEIEYETDRMRFLGRGRTPANPAALDSGSRLSRTTGPVLDPIFSLRRRVGLEAGMTTRIAFVTGAADTREAAIGIAERFREFEAIDQAFAGAKAHCQSELRELELTPDEIALFNRLAASVVFTNSVFATLMPWPPTGWGSRACGRTPFPVTCQSCWSESLGPTMRRSFANLFSGAPIPAAGD